MLEPKIVIYPHNHNGLKSLGFTNIQENKNGTFDGTVNNIRYFGVYWARSKHIEYSEHKTFPINFMYDRCEEIQ